jgi:hypothetical protein
MIWTGQSPSTVTARAGRQRASPGRRSSGPRSMRPSQERGSPAGRHRADHDRPHHRYHRGRGTGPAVTGISAVCVAIARPYAPRIGGRARHDARVSGPAGLRFRTIAVIPGPSRHERKSTANGVGPCGPPGFKSPILRSDQQFRPGRSVPGDCWFPLSGAFAWPSPQSGRPSPHPLPSHPSPSATPDARTCRDGRTSPDYQAVRRFGSGSMVLASGSNADRRAWSTIRRQPRA